MLGETLSLLQSNVILRSAELAGQGMGRGGIVGGAAFGAEVPEEGEEGDVEREDDGEAGERAMAFVAGDAFEFVVEGGLVAVGGSGGVAGFEAAQGDGGVGGETDVEHLRQKDPDEREAGNDGLKFHAFDTSRKVG